MMFYLSSIPAKFNCTVPGTRFGYSTVYPPKPTTSIAAQTTTNVISDSILVTTTIATNLTLLNERQPSKSEVGSRLFYAVVGVGSGMVTLLMCCLCCVCAMLICRQHRTKGKSNEISIVRIVYDAKIT